MSQNNKIENKANNKEHNFISAVVYTQNDNPQTIDFLQQLYGVLDEHFLQYEIVVVNANGAKSTNVRLKDWAANMDKPLTVVNMSLHQPHEQCMNAGLDITIGDYVYEFDSVDMPYEPELIWQAYETAMQGNDVVSVCPERVSGSSRLFYSLFNNNSNAAYKLRTDAFRLVSRRALNRAHAMNENLPYRKATYAACGLKMAELEFAGKQAAKTSTRLDLAMDSLILYTNFGYKFSLGLALLMLFGTIFMLGYTAFIYIVGNPVNGWTTTMLALTAGLTGLFAIMTIMLKYMTLILKLIFQKQSYLIEGIEKL